MSLTAAHLKILLRLLRAALVSLGNHLLKLMPQLCIHVFKHADPVSCLLQINL